MSEQEMKKRKTKIEILQTFREFFLQSERTEFNRSVMRNSPWNIDPRTAEEFFRIIHFCQYELPPLRIIEGKGDFLVQVMIPSTVLTIKEALEVIKERNTTGKTFFGVPWEFHAGKVTDNQKELYAAESHPKLANSEAYWANSRVHARFRCIECNSTSPFPWHCIEPMDIIEDNKLKCYKCMIVQEFPQCRCGKQMKLELCDPNGLRVREKSGHDNEKKLS